VVPAGLALYLAALDVTEPLAQEVDHPDLSASFNLPTGELHLRQLGPSAVLMVLVGAFGLLAAAVATGGATLTWELGAVVVVPAALCALGAGCLSVVKGPPPALSTQAVLIPEVAGMRAVGRLLWPPIMAILSLLPIVEAHSALRSHKAPVPAALALEQLVVVVAVGGLVWVRYQEDIHRWWQSQVEEAKSASGRGGLSR